MSTMSEAIGNPYLEIWTHPRSTIRRIVSVDPRYQVAFIAGLAGALSTLEAQWQSPVASPSSLWPVVVVIAVLIGTSVSIAGLYVNGVLFKWAGAALGGQATYVEVRAALAWSQIPAIAAVTLGLLSILFGNGGPMMPFRGGYAQGSGSMTLLHAILGIWAFVLTLKCLAEVHRFSAWRALAAILVVAAGVLVLFLVVLAATGAFSHLFGSSASV
jgi:Yip1 domain